MICCDLPLLKCLICVRKYNCPPSCYDWFFYCMMRLSPLFPPIYQVIEVTFAAERLVLSRGAVDSFPPPLWLAEAEPSSHQVNWFFIVELNPLNWFDSYWSLPLSPYTTVAIITDFEMVIRCHEWIFTLVMYVTWTHSLEQARPYTEYIYSTGHRRMLICLMFIKVEIACVCVCTEVGVLKK